MNTEAGLNKDREEEVGKGGLGTKKRGQLGQTEKLREVLSYTGEFGERKRVTRRWEERHLG